MKSYLKIDQYGAVVVEPSKKTDGEIRKSLEELVEGQEFSSRSQIALTISIFTLTGIQVLIANSSKDLGLQTSLYVLLVGFVGVTVAFGILYSDLGSGTVKGVEG